VTGVQWSLKYFGALLVYTNSHLKTFQTPADRLVQCCAKRSAGAIAERHSVVKINDRSSTTSSVFVLMCDIEKLLMSVDIC